MTKILNGSELVGYIKERQARQVRALRQASRVFPRLVVIKSKSASPVIDTYVRMKGRYGDDILIETVVETLDESEMPAAIERANNDDAVHGIIVQLPLDDPAKTDEIVNSITPEKDVDGLGVHTKFESATAKAIHWLLAGYAIDLKGKKIAIVGNGRLVGAPLAKIWRDSGYDVTVLTRASADIAGVLKDSAVIVTATGVPHLITTDMIGIGAVVVDAGTASEDGVIVGDIDDSVRTRDDLTVTPEKGGVGPLTIAALFDNVIASAQAVAEQKTKN
ncbi:MAG: bifunctional 5,10-methylenetetrahydrofolate dehydrogenase/5,10-methenyltetrahydrofolate cyclohydrolase [Candidatus Saccharibacteria bacterium]|nr:MAG: bifunctional 5,10-methylenetetrahydrofolate dehydrogenase/5,10-methenyltetrahydrofolate cyclohydrolase [Candidatus Saccharibacteria bacterium]